MPIDLPSLRDRLTRRVSWDDLDRAALADLVERAQGEDLGGYGFRQRPGQPGDVTAALLDPTHRGAVVLRAREDGVACGLGLIPMILSAYDVEAEIRLLVEDGARFTQDDLLARIEGPVAGILSAERVMLNFVQRLSGVATETARYVAALRGSETRLLDTRKTTPGFRALEKYAVACGGGTNHRLGLYDRIILKDNHLALSGNDRGDRLTAAVREAMAQRPDLVVEVEVDSLEQLEAVLEAGAPVVLLDNFRNEELRVAQELCQDRALTEASGGITVERLPVLAAIGLDFISTGATVHRARWLDLGLDGEGSR